MIEDKTNTYIKRFIDSRNVYITNKAYLEKLKLEWGEDSDLFKVRVRGMFPSIASVQFMDSSIVNEAMLRLAISDKNDPLLIGVDVARFGDNNTVIYPRIGNDARSWPYQCFNRLDTTQVVDKVIGVISEFAKIGKKVSGLFVDGGGVGGGVVDQLRKLGYNPIDVNFGGKASDPRYAYKGDEMWGKLREAMPRLALPNHDNLRGQLIQREFGFTPTGKIKLMSKEDMVEAGMISPDIADALALTYAANVATQYNNEFGNVRREAKSEYDPYGQKAWEM
jgi:hypothetical protein